MAKATEAEKTERINKFIDLLLSGKTNVYMCQYAADKWGVSSRQAYRYFHEAKKEVRKVVDIDRGEMVAQHRLHLAWLYGKAVEKRDYNCARLCMLDIAKLMGLNAPDEQNINATLTIWDEYNQFKKDKK